MSKKEELYGGFLKFCTHIINLTQTLCFFKDLSLYIYHEYELIADYRPNTTKMCVF